MYTSLPGVGSIVMENSRRGKVDDDDDEVAFLLTTAADDDDELLLPGLAVDGS